jgi:hypothetical protein
MLNIIYLFIIVLDTDKTLKHQAQNYKLQINLKFKYQNPKHLNSIVLFEILDFGHCDLFGT